MNISYIKGYKAALEVVQKQLDNLKILEQITGDPYAYYRRQAVEKTLELVVKNTPKEDNEDASY